MTLISAVMRRFKRNRSCNNLCFDSKICHSDATIIFISTT
ncbi:hypothetical protein B4U80_08037, partial [Leptotrombidium deliense]